MDYIPEHIEQLLESNDFESLDSQSQKEVLEIMSKEEYARYRKIMTEGAALRNSGPEELYNTTKIRGSLLASYDDKYAERPTGFFRKILTVRTPLYQPALAVSALLFFFYFLFGSLEPEAIKIIETTTVHDTIRIEKEMPGIPDTVYISLEQDNRPQRKISGKSPANLSSETLHEINNFDNSLTGRAIQKAPDLDAIMKSSHAGRTLKDDSAMKKYLVAAQ